MSPVRVRIAIAFAILYLVWGSTYLAIRWAVEGTPPLLVAGVRFVCAGAVLLLVARLRGAAPLRVREWGRAGILGGLFFGAGNGGVTWAAAAGVPTGTVAMLVATVPLWMILFGWARGGPRPRPRMWLGLGLGLLGTGVLVQPQAIGAAHVVPAAIVVAGSMGWAYGSLLARSWAGERDALSSAAMQMLAGSVWLLALALVRGELAMIPASISARALGSFVYLVLFGSVLGFGAYVWLLRRVAPARVATYAYVNPAVAVLLGLVVGEQLSAMAWLAMGLVLVGVILGLGGGSTRPRPVASLEVLDDRIGAEQPELRVGIPQPRDLVAPATGDEIVTPR